MTNDPSRDMGVRAGRLLLALIVVAAAAMRVWGAWWGRNITDPDASVVALMVRHMVQGLDFPWFFYGQLYMGSFEPAVSAVIGKLFGVSGFTVNLGTAMVSMALIPVVYAWGRDAGSRASGLIAAAYCVIGSPSFLGFQYNPRGGYAAVIALGAAILWLAVRAAADDTKGYRPSIAFLGFLAGFAWWVDPLVVMALVPAVIVILIGRGWSALRPSFWLPGVATFVVGGLPFWWRAVTGRGDILFALLETKKCPFAEGFADFLVRIQKATGLNGLNGLAWWVALVLVVLAVIVVVVNVARHVRQHRSLVFLSNVAVVAMLVASCIIFSTSAFSRENTSRYLLPMIPALAVAMGCLGAQVMRLHRSLVAIPFVAMVLLQGPMIQSLRNPDGRGYAMTILGAPLRGFLEAQGIRTVYTTFMFYPLNFFLDERFDFTLMEEERLLDRAVRAEHDDRPAFFGYDELIAAFLRTSGGDIQRSDVAGVNLLHDAKAPVVAWSPIDPSLLAVGDSSMGAFPAGELMDGHHRTGLPMDRKEGADGWLSLAFREATPLVGLRISFPDHPSIPGRWAIDVLTESGEWREVVAPSRVAPLYWSGPRFFHGGFATRVEVRFAEVLAKGVRIRFPKENPSSWALSELHPMGPSEPMPAEAASLDLALRALREHDVTRVYADRWAANRLHERTGGALWTSRVAPRSSLADDVVTLPVTLESGTALLVRRDAAMIAEMVLDRAKLEYGAMDVGPWRLYVDLKGNPDGLEWAGWSLMTW